VRKRGRRRRKKRALCSLALITFLVVGFIVCYTLARAYISNGSQFQCRGIVQEEETGGKGGRRRAAERERESGTSWRERDEERKRRESFHVNYIT
jgi:hypothetical protein